uniref:Uncharacterized protein n=1 Tax=Compsopogon caeruleus TaxID=31354 RepID=A0A7S1TBT6_9RHOD
MWSVCFTTLGGLAQAQSSKCGSGTLTYTTEDDYGETTNFRIQVTDWPTVGADLPEGTVIEMESAFRCRCDRFFGQGAFQSQGSVYSVQINQTNANEFLIVCHHPIVFNGTFCAPTLWSFDHVECQRDSTRVNVGGDEEQYYLPGSAVTVSGGQTFSDMSAQVPFSSGVEGEATLTLDLEDGVYKVFLPMANQGEENRTFSIEIGDVVDAAQYTIIDINILSIAPGGNSIFLDMGNIYVKGALKISLKNGASGKPIINGIIATKVDLLSIGTIDPTQVLQRVVGFGANMVFYLNWLTNHPNRDKIYDIIFGDLRPQVLRVRNDYDSREEPSTPGDVGVDLGELLRACKSKTGYIPYVIMGAWGAPVSITEDETLKKHPDGSYFYPEYTAFWTNSLDKHALKGVRPNVIFIQNEPDYYDPAHETTRFNPTEDIRYAGYGHAADSIYKALRGRDLRPELVGPDVTGLNYSALLKYIYPSLGAFLNVSQFKAYSHHLYHLDLGGDFNDPDSFEYDMKKVSGELNDKEKWMTEYARWLGPVDQDDYLLEAWTIHNTMVWERANMYIHWDLFWNMENSTLVGLEDSWQPDTWQTPDGFVVHQTLYSLMLWTRYVRAGWVQIKSSTSLGDMGTLRISAWKHPFDAHFTVIAINLRSDPYPLALSGLSKLIGARAYCTNQIDKAALKFTVKPSLLIRLPGKTVCAITTLRA